jgi:hypothetical protein
MPRFADWHPPNNIMNPSLERLEPRIVPANLLPDLRTVQYTDGDGDLVTVKISKGRFDLQNDFTFGATETGIGEQLQVLNLAGKTGFDRANLTITAKPGATGGDGVVNVGYINATDLDLGAVTVRGDLAAIDAGDVLSDPALASLTVLSFGAEGTSTGAPDLDSYIFGPVGSIKVTGDFYGVTLLIDGIVPPDRLVGTLGSLFIGGALVGGAGDRQGAIRCVGSLGTVTIGGSVFGGGGELSGSIGADSIKSISVGGSLIGRAGQDSGQFFATNTIGKVTIGGTMTGDEGDGSGSIFAKNLPSVTVGNSVFGGVGISSGSIQGEKLGTIAIGGSLLGGGGQSSGLVFSETTLGKVTIGGTMSGGDGEISGGLSAQNISTVTIGNSVFGGVGDGSGSIRGEKLGTVSIAGAVYGGGGESAGLIYAETTLAKVTIGGPVIGSTGEFSGAVFANKITSVTVGNSVIGGAGAQSGSIQAVTDIGSLKISGSLVGGAGAFSGYLYAGGTLASATILGDVFGGSDNGNDFLGGSGYIEAGRITNLTIGGSVIAGDNNGGGVVNCGAIRAHADIGTLTIRGSLEGGTSPAIISAVGQPNANGATDLAIKNLTILGRVRFAEILAGYSPDVSNSIYGEPVNADAQIGSVKVGGDWVASDLIAGVSHGGDQYFGDANDAKITGGTKDLTDLSGPRAISKIASIVIGGRVIGTSPIDDVYRNGFAAQQIGRVTVGGVTVIPLLAGSSTDTFGAQTAYSLGTTRGTGTADGWDVHVYEV